MRLYLLPLLLLSTLGCDGCARPGGPAVPVDPAWARFGGGVTLVLAGSAAEKAVLADKGPDAERPLGLIGCVAADVAADVLPPIGMGVVRGSAESPTLTGDSAIDWCRCADLYAVEPLGGIGKEVAASIRSDLEIAGLLTEAAPPVGEPAKDCRSRAWARFAFGLLDQLPEQIDAAVTAQTCRLELVAVVPGLAECAAVALGDSE